MVLSTRLCFKGFTWIYSFNSYNNLKLYYYYHHPPRHREVNFFMLTQQVSGKVDVTRAFRLLIMAY